MCLRALLGRMLNVLLLLPLVACAERDSAPDIKQYSAHFSAELLPAENIARARLQITQTSSELRELNLFAPPARFENFSADGEISRSGDRLRWQVPAGGGSLTYSARIDHQRAGSFDARLTRHWAIFRLGDLFPPARARTVKGAVSVSTVSLQAPEGWSIETRYGPAPQQMSISNDRRRFDRPTGWAVAGKLGTRRDTIASRRVTISAPVNSGFRRQDTLAFVRWTLPELVHVFPGFPPRLLITGATDEMWRGGLSGPGSIYLHPSRPLISENATSTLLHELVHISMPSPPAAGDDWIVEGLAEYYSLQILRRSGGISEQRLTGAFDSLQKWVAREGGRLADPSTGADTARAVLLFRDLDAQLADADGSLDTVARSLAEDERPNRARLQELIEAALGEPSAILETALTDADPS